MKVFQLLTACTLYMHGTPCKTANGQWWIPSYSQRKTVRPIGFSSSAILSSVRLRSSPHKRAACATHANLVITFCGRTSVTRFVEFHSHTQTQDLHFAQRVSPLPALASNGIQNSCPTTSENKKNSKKPKPDNCTLSLNTCNYAPAMACNYERQMTRNGWDACGIHSQDVLLTSCWRWRLGITEEGRKTESAMCVWCFCRWAVWGLVLRLKVRFEKNDG